MTEAVGRHPQSSTLPMLATWMMLRPFFATTTVDMPGQVSVEDLGVQSLAIHAGLLHIRLGDLLFLCCTRLGRMSGCGSRKFEGGRTMLHNKMDAQLNMMQKDFDVKSCLVDHSLRSACTMRCPTDHKPIARRRPART